MSQSLQRTSLSVCFKLMKTKDATSIKFKFKTNKKKRNKLAYSTNFKITWVWKSF